MSIRSRSRGNRPSTPVAIGGMIVTLILGLLMGLVGGYGIATWFQDSARDRAATEAMFKALTPAKPDIAAALQKRAAESKDPTIIRSAARIYVAKTDVTLAPVDEPMVVILPQGLRWVGGQLGNITLLRTDALGVEQVKRGFEFYDPWCQGEMMGVVPAGTCGSPRANVPATLADMESRLRKPTQAELTKLLDKDELKGANPKLYRIATKNFVAAPSYWGNSDRNMLTIFLPPGIKVMGGQLGYVYVVPLDGQGKPKASSYLTDELCQRNNAPDETKAGKLNVRKPLTFAPAAELKRVSECQYPM